LENAIKNVGAAAFITDDHDRILLVHHTYGELNWELPGGIGELNETPAETAVREVFEETGLTVVAREMTGYYYTSENDKLHFVYRCEKAQASAVLLPDGAEVSECAYWPQDALPRPISDWTIRRIQDAISGGSFGLPTIIGPRVWLK